MTPHTCLTDLDRDRVLETYRIVFTGHEALFDDLVHLASVAVDVPVAYFALMTEETHWIKAGEGVGQLATPRKVAICNAAVESGELVVIEDASADDRWCDHPFVTGPAHLRAYASQPLRGYGGMVIGTLCVYDTKARSWSAEEIDRLVKFGRQLEVHLENRRKFLALSHGKNVDDKFRATVAALTAEQRIINRRMVRYGRNLVSAVNVNASVLEDTVDAKTRHEIVHDLRGVCVKMMELIDEIESFAFENNDVSQTLTEDTDLDLGWDENGGTGADTESTVG